ncbi:MAG: ATP-binding cassette domain-containing protein [Sphingomonadales bacterium]|nr:ATP-binding cassette domain-containing protein [Sphingomonadales bacterium]
MFALGLATWVAAHELRGAWPLLGLTVSGFVRAVAQLRAAIVGQIAANSAKQDLRARMLAPLLETGFRRGRLPGEDMRNAIDDVELADGYVGRFLPLKLSAVLSPLLIAALAALASPISAAIMLATLLPFAVGMAFAGLAARDEADRQLLALSRMSGLFVDRARALPLILSFAAEARITRQVGDAAHEVATRTLRVLRVAFLSSAILEFFAALSVALVAVYCGFSLLHLLPFPAPERLDLFRAFFVLALAPEFYLGMRRLAAAYHEKQQGEASQRAIAPVLAEAEALQVPLGSNASIERLAVRDWIIAYPDGSRIGPVTAEWPGLGLHCLTGPTGCGKTSLLLGLIGMVPTANGLLLVNDRAVEPGSLNRQVGWAGQRPLLLPGTLAENLTAGCPDPSDMPAVVESLRLARLLATRGETLPITPDGAGLSGGERRRIGIARALLSRRPVLLLDEPTADLDAETAAAVIACLRRHASGRLLIIATHDPALLASADSTLALG